MQAPYGSNLNSPVVRGIYAQIAEAAVQARIHPVEEPAGVGDPKLFGFNLNSPQVQQAMAGVEQAAGKSQGVACVQLVKNSLNGGELAPGLRGRFDLPRYQMGCHKLLNMIPLPAGGITKRPGLRHVWRVSQDENIRTRLVPFSYSSSLKLMALFVASSNKSRLVTLDRDGNPGSDYECVVPYGPMDLESLSCCQCGKFLYLAHPDYPPARLEYDGSNFTYKVLDFSNKTPVPAIGGFNFEGWAEQNTGRNVFYKITAINDETGEESLPSPEACWFTCTLNTSFSALIRIVTVPGCSEYRVYKKRGGVFGYIGRIHIPPGTVGSGSLPQGTDPDVFHDIGYEPDTNDTPPREQTFFQGKGNYPALVFIHQQRLGWASTDNDPLTVWMSQTSNFECLASKQPPRDDDAIEATLASSQANRILWAESDRSGLALGTEGEEWYLTGAGGEGAAVTPNSLSFQPQTRYGTQAGTHALRADSSLLFIQRGARIIRDLGYSFQADRYEARDLTLLARHIFQNDPISDWCWQGSPHYILWCVTASGKLAALTYMPDNEVIAWHRHQTLGTIKSCATLDDRAGISRLWLVVSRPGQGTAIEIMDHIHEPLPDTDSLPPASNYTDGAANQPITARVIPCLPEASANANGSPFRISKINAINARVLDSYPFACRITDQHGHTSQTLPVPIRPGNPDNNNNWTSTSFTHNADWHCPLGAGFRQGSQLELVCDGPNPLTILALNITCELADTTASQTGGV